jgi:hypothetical protein
MILRKPYAFFIKYFKAFHYVIAALSIFLMVRMTSVTSFINAYLDNPFSKLITKDQAHSVFNAIDFVLPIVLILISGALWGIMKLKKKPHKLYIFIFFSFLATLIINFYCHSRMIALTKIWLKAEELSALVDAYVFVMALLMADCIICVSRALGFNIKQLDFKNDLTELNSDSTDSEEFEVAIDFDVNDVKRDLKKGTRHFKYFVKENNSLIKYGGIALGVILALSIVIGAYNNRKIVVKGDLDYNGFTVKINKAYSIDTDLKGNKLKNDKNLIVVDVDITNNQVDPAIFLTGTVMLNIGDTNYSTTRQFDNEISDLGTVYNGDKIRSKDTVNRLLVFEVPVNRLMSKKLLGIKNLGDRYYYSKLNVEYYNNKKNSTKDGYKVGDTLDLKDSILGDASLKIKNFEIQKKYKLSYTYCYKKNKCIASTEYIVPQNVVSNYDKVLMRLDVEENLSNTSFNNFYKLFSKYGYIEYKKDGKTYYQNGNFFQVSSSRIKEKNIYYIEVINNVYQADSITLGLKIRNMDYKYKLAEGRN